MNVGYLPWNRPEPAASRPCLRDERSDLTYAEVGQRVAAFAEELAERGLGPGDVLGIMLPNRVELLIGLLAAWRVGAAVTPINPAFTENEAGYQLRDSGARLVLNGGPDAPSAGLPAIHVGEMRCTARGNLPERAVRPEELALLVYTSGSTGRPKGVMLDHANLGAMASAMAEHFRATDADHCLLVLPLFHVNAICVSFLTMMLRGGQLTVLERFDPKSFLAAVERYRPTYFSAVPTIYARLAELPGEFTADTSSLRFAVCGAAPVSRELLEHCESRFGFVMVEGYGLTEGTCASACNPVDGVRKLGTVGPALPGQRIATISPGGDLLPAGAVGEVVVQGANVMRGYLNRPAETAATLAGGWLRTGDVGRIDEDGYLTLVDRLKDMIIRGGENVYPKEIESVLHGHPGVLEAAVVGVPHAVYGEVPVACVVRYPDASVTVEELLERCRADLTKIKLPVEVHLLDALPKNPVGKIDKPALRKALQAR
ncbi:AMP-binding protein [Saccharopolyspora indica]|uniref:class I adenylate-forming enzyme family protein n=1 Tax=Saccharopolyspora indica TaxID=1229659 RepID=UPI0022EB270F|nr:AMP-binding protein [Saccharopolyspora indica]MDA3642818.1 AMP-binding protein [Saccharopolyspora indica]